MRRFRQLVMLGILLVTILVFIDTIDAGRKGKKKELETDNSYDQENSKFNGKNKNTESTKHNKVKRSGSERTENYEDENQYVSKDSIFESKKADVKKNIKFASKEKRYTGNEKIKTSKHFQKFKKSVLDEEPFERSDSSKTKAKKTKSQSLKTENVDRIFKTVKKTTQKKLVEENENAEKILNEEFNRLKNEEAISMEEATGGNQKKKKYKLVEVVLQEDGQEEEQEGNETAMEPEFEDQEFVSIVSEEISETRFLPNPKLYKNQKTPKNYNDVENEKNDEPESINHLKYTEEIPVPEDNVDFDKNKARYRYVDATEGICENLPVDPTRKEPKKLTLYVVEEEMDGEMVKRVVSEEDGVTMCEVAELLTQIYKRANVPLPDL